MSDQFNPHVRRGGGVDALAGCAMIALLSCAIVVVLILTAVYLGGP